MHITPRSVVRAAALLLPVGLSVALADSAAASTPINWAPGEGYSTLQTLGIYVGIPLGLFILIWLLASIHPGKTADAYPIRPKRSEEEWFGGPAQVEASEHHELTQGSETGSESGASESRGAHAATPPAPEPAPQPKPGGGASASW